MKTQTGKKIIPSGQQQAMVKAVFGNQLGQQIINDVLADELGKKLAELKWVADEIKSVSDKLPNLFARTISLERKNGYSIAGQYFGLNGCSGKEGMATKYFGGAK